MQKTDPHAPTGPYQSVVLAPATGFKGRWLAIAFLAGACIGGAAGATLRVNPYSHDPPSSAQDEDARPVAPSTATTFPNSPAEQQIRGQLLWEIHRARQHGVLIVEDGRAKTVKDNLPALGSNRGFIKLEYGAYPVQTYAVEKEGTFGIGVAGDPAKMSFLFLWQNGSTPPPRAPNALELATGRRVIAKDD